jgi:hypothetical protein
MFILSVTPAADAAAENLAMSNTKSKDRPPTLLAGNLTMKKEEEDFQTLLRLYLCCAVPKL